MSDPPKMMFNFQVGASHEVNSAIFSQAADVVWKEQYDQETCSLTHQTLAEDCEKAMDDYITQHHINPFKLLWPEYMSDQVSELHTDDKDEKQARKKDIQKAANLSECDVHAGVPVWETIRPAWRSEEVSNIFKELDSIQDEQRKECKQKMALTRHVNLSNNNNTPLSIPIFPFMLNSKWHDSYQAGTPYAPIKMYKQDPRGFKKQEGQHDEDLPQGNSEKASKNSSTDGHSVNGDGNGDDADDTLDGDS
ncbi:hypothetical protein DFH29DRAFT_871636 [Suillus ampliporus]|nr:hypothetical protein DFH29DRAFT_871636 [Suillus ampliporus]